MSDDYELVRNLVEADIDPILITDGRAAALAGPSGARMAGIAPSSIDENGFIVSWGPITFINDSMASMTDLSIEDTLYDPLTEGNIGIYQETIEGSSQYDWDLASELGTFKLYSPIQNFSSTLPSLHAQSINSFSSELNVIYDASEIEGLANKFGTLPTGETAKSRIISKTQEIAAQIALKRKKKLTFTKAANNYKLATSDFYSIQTFESTNMVSVEVTSTTGSFNRPQEGQSSGRVTYTSYGSSNY